MLCNGPLPLLIAIVAAVSLLGCKKDSADMETADAGGTGGAKAAALETADAEIVPPLPVTPLELFRHFPAPPVGIAAIPGDGMEKLSDIRERLKDSYYSPRVLVEHPDEGPYRMVHYQLNSDGSEVAAIMATFTPAYSHGDRKASLEEAISLRIGKGTKFKTKNYEGIRWKIMDFRVELRTDKGSPFVELLMHRRGSIDPTAKKKKKKR